MQSSYFFTWGALLERRNRNDNLAPLHPANKRKHIKEHREKHRACRFVMQPRYFFTWGALLERRNRNDNLVLLHPPIPNKNASTRQTLGRITLRSTQSSQDAARGHHPCHHRCHHYHNHYRNQPCLNDPRDHHYHHHYRSPPCKEITWLPHRLIIKKQTSDAKKNHFERRHGWSNWGDWKVIGQLFWRWLEGDWGWLEVIGGDWRWLGVICKEKNMLCALGIFEKDENASILRNQNKKPKPGWSEPYIILRAEKQASPFLNFTRRCVF